MAKTDASLSRETNVSTKQHATASERTKDLPFSQTGNPRRSHNPYHAAAPRRVEVEKARVQIDGGEIRPGGRAGARDRLEQSTVLIKYSPRRVQPGDA